ncbi:hypothetical protein DPMN_094148 [Dreissena polymorpha]|uniref:Secreted protein n=1 Tax=Dreissena polymorpha TaxID=45954 RepID=A0A9D4L583_DREPO|nr:hypothetical protein DPMN_094148 [Dreissena polymorpha]
MAPVQAGTTVLLAITLFPFCEWEGNTLCQFTWLEFPTNTAKLRRVSFIIRGFRLSAGVDQVCT